MTLLGMVDAVNGEATLAKTAEARKQVILADRLIVSKSDLAVAADLENLTRRLQHLNPRAVIDIAVGGTQPDAAGGYADAPGATISLELPGR